MDEILNLHDDEAGPWLDAQQPRLHVVLGDSVARDCGLHAGQANDRVLNLSKGGATWATLRDGLEERMTTWRQVARDEGRRLGVAVVWLSGNDVYSRITGLPCASEEVLWLMQESAKGVTDALLDAAEGVVVLGPIARLGSEVLPVQRECSQRARHSA